ncbi:hypothetical protein SAY86_021497 [Trapa natans]|uniref:Uncharacterized protein n=1 Tax=Trapa natans TaxID=22666 RepID=A0AAN7MSI4_TRANT|nr:hypothetical protein SAY86_021497 [Trapa natans]
MVEFILGDVGYYDVSLVDCFNISTIIIPVKYKQNCTTVGCHGDLMKNCLVELALYTSDKSKMKRQYSKRINAALSSESHEHRYRLFPLRLRFHELNVELRKGEGRS